MLWHHVHGISTTIQNKMKRRSRNFITCVWDGRHYGISVGIVNVTQQRLMAWIMINFGNDAMNFVCPFLQRQ